MIPGATPSDVVIPARDDYVETGGIERGKQFLEVLASIGHDVANREVADLGAGFGSIALAAASRGGRVTAVDIRGDRLQTLRQRAAGLGLTVATREANLLEGRLDIQSDLALMIGVVEYAGLWDPRPDAAAVQADVLRTARQVVRPDGALIMATKNRIWPKSLVSDVHTGRPLVAVLPRKAASALSQRLDGVPYRHWIHSPGKWRVLLREAGFSAVHTYFPYLGYQFPLAMVERPQLRDIGRLHTSWTTAGESRKRRLGRMWPVKIALMAAARQVGLELSQSVIFVARP